MFIYDLKKGKLVQILKCEEFLSVSVLENDLIRVKLFNKKAGKEGFINFLPYSGCKKIAHEINAIIRHFTHNFIFD